MRIKEIMSSKPDLLAPTDTLKKAASLMREHDFGFLPIGENDRLIGVVTDRDITTRGVAQGKDPDKTPVKDVMTKEVWYCFEDDDDKKAVKSMEDKQIRRLMVLNKDKRLTGVVSLGDIATKCKNKSLSGEALEEISEKG